jgi:hypothetical protein
MLSLPRELNPKENGQLIFHYTESFVGFGASFGSFIPFQN